MTSAREIRLDARLERHEPQLVESRGCLPQHALVGDVREGRPTPERE